jgi:alanine racemase
MNPSLSFRRPTVAEIDLKALAFNYRQIQKRLPKGVRILAVVKADAYGHGALPVSHTLERLGVEYLGVAIPEEGIELRRGGIKTPILILGGIYPGEADEIIKYGLTPVVFDLESLKSLSRAGEKRGKKVKIHLKVDTGMGRLGVPFEEFQKFLEKIGRCPQIEVEGLLSHFALIDEGEGYTEGQWEKFQKAIAMVKEVGLSCRYFHMANSGILTLFPHFSGNLVRPGIMIYGSYPSIEFQSLIELKPVLTLKTRIHYLKSVPKGSKIGYGGTFTTKRESLIATLPVGYADGYSLQLSNQGEVLIKGRRAPIVGRVCMDFTMVDVTEVPKVGPGDEVILIGRQGQERITPEEIAGKIGSIPYEVLCLIGKRVPRIYKE